jgi:hypothetical protein
MYIKNSTCLYPSISLDPFAFICGLQEGAEQQIHWDIQSCQHATFTTRKCLGCYVV